MNQDEGHTLEMDNLHVLMIFLSDSYSMSVRVNASTLLANQSAAFENFAQNLYEEFGFRIFVNLLEVKELRETLLMLIGNVLIDEPQARQTLLEDY